MYKMSATKNIYGMVLSVSFLDADGEVQIKKQSIGKLIANHTCVFTWDLRSNGLTAELVISADVIDQADIDSIKSQTSFYSVPNALSSRFPITKSLNPFLQPKNELVNSLTEVKMSNLTQKIKSLFSRDAAPVVTESTVVAVSSAPVVPVVSAVEEVLWVCPFTTLSEEDVLVHDSKLVVSKRTSRGKNPSQSVIQMAIEMNTRSASEGLEKAVELVWDGTHQIFTSVANIPGANGYRFLTEQEWSDLVADAVPELYLGSEKKYTSDPTNINQYGLWNMLGDTWDVVIAADGNFLAKGGSKNNLRADCNKSYSIDLNIYEKRNFGFRFCRNA